MKPTTIAELIRIASKEAAIEERRNMFIKASQNSLVWLLGDYSDAILSVMPDGVPGECDAVSADAQSARVRFFCDKELANRAEIVPFEIRLTVEVLPTQAP